MQPLPSQDAFLQLASHRPAARGLVIETAWRALGTVDAGRLARAADRALAEASIAALGGVVDAGRARLVPATRGPVQVLDFDDAAFERWRDRPGPAFDGAPLVEVVIARVGATAVAELRAHHAVADGYALVLLFRRIVEHYRADGDGAAPPPPSGDLAALAAAAAPLRAPDQQFWAPVLEGLGEPGTDVAFTARTALPADRPRRHRTRIAVPGLPGRRTWPSEAVGVIGAYTARYLGAADARLGVVAALRRTPLERATPVQWTAVVPLRLPVAAGDTAAELGRHVRRWLDAAGERVRAGERPEQLRTVVPAAWRLGRVHGPVVNVLPYVHVEGFALDVGAWGPVEDCLINVVAQEGDGLLIDGAFHPDLYDDAQVRDHVERIADLLAAALAAPDAAVPAVAPRPADPRRVPIPGGWIVPDDAVRAVASALAAAGVSATVGVRAGERVTVELAGAGEEALPLARAVLPPGVRVRLA